MRTGLLGKQSYPVLEGISYVDGSHDAYSLKAASIYNPDPERSDDSRVVKSRHTGSKVWADIRGAIKAIGRSSRSSTCPDTRAWGHITRLTCGTSF